MNCRAHQVGDLHVALGAQELVERDDAEQVVARVDDVDLVELVGQVLLGAQVVDRLPDRPERRDGDEIRLHQTAGGILREVEAALQRQPLERRQLRKDLLAVGVVDVLEDVDGVVAVEAGNAARDLVVRDLLDDLGADVLVDFGQGRVVEPVAEEIDQRDAFVGLKRLQHVAGVGGVKGLHRPRQQHRHRHGR